MPTHCILGSYGILFGWAQKWPLKSEYRPPRLCLGLFAAADALGLGFVHGVAPLVYLERLEPGVLERLGLSLEAPGASPDLYVRAPAARESVFRGAVRRDGTRGNSDDLEHLLRSGYGRPLDL